MRNQYEINTKSIRFMEKLVDLIKGRLTHHSLASPAQSAEVLFFANQLLKAELNPFNDRIQAYKLEKGVLYISSPNSVWSQELWGVQKTVLIKIKSRFGDQSVKKVQIKSLTIE